MPATLRLSMLAPLTRHELLLVAAPVVLLL
jgi:hypothetical protein